MRASLDTNVIIHFYRAQRQEVLFEVFDEGVFIYEQIRYIELEHHAKDLLEKIDLDILSGKIELYTDQKLKELAVLNLFEINVVENRNLYGSGDLGEVYAIVTTNGMRTIKRLGPSNNTKCYTLVPTNKSPEYGIQELPKDMIKHIFQVLGCMKRL